ncbi:hypothetical protein K227x_36790 [Rubripirellula lacrimiformis]|uniref:DUF1559 domain-containing protein n=1 Tax=Rubripirellula lacrimiformis TaxID=1930273 RepID=A0A517NDS3_9BACT|nr:DUF1559 domain-containing protein [Rubripirellula lacrimiformis]QDT05279.1 hypothetical protein K227x_36790 [Rubripirellula lacrimiformis]
MNQKSWITAVSIVLLVNSSVPAARGQGVKQVEIPPVLINDVDTGSTRVHPATPYLESTSFALWELDITQIDLGSLLTWINQTTGNDFDSKSVQPELEMFQSLRDGGIDGLCVTASLPSIAERFPLIILPTDTAGKSEAVAKSLRRWMDARLIPGLADQWDARSDQSSTLIGASTAIDRAMNPKPARRFDLTERDSDDAKLPQRISVAFDDGTRSDLALLLPQSVPRSWGAGALGDSINLRQAISDIRRVVVSWRMPPRPEIRLRIETGDLAAAERTKELVTGLLSGFTAGSDAFDVECVEQTVVVTASEDQIIRQLKVQIPNSADRLQLAKQKSLGRLSLALHNFNSAYRHLPAGVYTDPDGNPLYGWRTAILPFLDQVKLWKSLDPKQSWDSEANRAVRSTVVPIYAAAVDPASDLASTHTTLRAPVFPGSVWHGTRTPAAIDDATDGLKETIVLIDAPPELAVEWSDPDQWILAEDDVVGQIFGDRDEVMVVMLWGDVRTLKRSEMTEAKMKSMLTASAGD